MKKLFDRFFIVQTASGSTGLGLSIAKALTGRIGGSICAEYENGRLRVRIQNFPNKFCGRLVFKVISNFAR